MNNRLIGLSSVLLASLFLLCSCAQRDFRTMVRDGDIHGCKDALAANPALANTLDSTGSPPLMLAAGNNHEELVRLLLKSGANVNAREPHLQTTALHWASIKGNLGIVQMLIEAGADVNARNKVGESPYDMAVIGEQTAIIEFLSRHGGKSAGENGQ